MALALVWRVVAVWLLRTDRLDVLLCLLLSQVLGLLDAADLHRLNSNRQIQSSVPNAEPAMQRQTFCLPSEPDLGFLFSLDDLSQLLGLSLQFDNLQAATRQQAHGEPHEFLCAIADGWRMIVNSCVPGDIATLEASAAMISLVFSTSIFS